MRRRPTYDRAVVQRLILERIEAGWTLARLDREPGFPSPPTVRAWARQDPGFANLLRWARNWRRGAKVERRAAGRAFSPAWAEDFLVRLGRGEMVGSRVGGPGQPSRGQLSEWRRAQPAFDAAVAAAVRRWRGKRQGRPAYNEAVADRIVLRLWKGATLDDVYADPDLPGRQIVRRWRRLVPEFDGALRRAWRSGWRVRRRAARGCNDDAVTEPICLHILDGGSLRSAAAAVPDAPSLTTLYAWRASHAVFARSVALAEQMRDELLAGRALDGMERLLERGDLSSAEAAAAQDRLRRGQLHGGRRRRD